MTIVEFLRARLVEDERAARRAKAFKYDRPTDAPWERARLAVEQGAGLSSGEHIARNDPARVLAEVEAKRRIVEAFAADDNRERYGGCGDDCEWKALDYVLRLLALPYADHPDYRDEWRP